MLIQFDNVHKRFGSFQVLDGVTFTVQPHQTTAIIGPSGAGKSVLLKHIVGLIKPDEGAVLVDGVDITQASNKTINTLRARQALMFQDGALFDSLSVGENVGFPLLHGSKISTQARRARVERCLDMVELPGIYDRPTPSLSGGQRKRVALARAIVTEPEAILFDEPNSGLDPVTSDTIDRLISRMKVELGITFIVITHDIVSAMTIADQIGMLWKGRMIQFGSPDAFRATTNPVVKQFLARNIQLNPKST